MRQFTGNCCPDRTFESCLVGLTPALTSRSALRACKLRVERRVPVQRVVASTRLDAGFVAQFVRQLEHDPVGIKREHLRQRRFGWPPLAKRQSKAFEARPLRRVAVRPERNVVHRARFPRMASIWSESTLAAVKMDQRIAIDAEPCAGKRERGPRHALQAD